MISLMLAMTVSCGVLLTSVSLLQIARDNFQHQHQAVLLEDSAAFALDIIARTLQQAAQTGSLASLEPRSETLPFKISDGSVQGLDNVRMSSDVASMGVPSDAAINGSDVMAVNLRSVEGDAINCAGFLVPGESSQSHESSWVFFHVVPGADGEPELHCRYRGQQKWDSQTILSGVEFFQVLYGLDTEGDNLPNQFLSASAMVEKDKAKPVSDSSFWHSVVAVYVALVLRSPSGDDKSSAFKGVALFGDHYVPANASADPGTRIDTDDLTAAVRTRAPSSRSDHFSSHAGESAVNGHPLRPAALHSGMTLVACSLLLLGVAVLASASLRSLQDDVSLTYNNIDHLLAQHAAEIALRDAATTLSMIPKDLTIGQALGSHHLGDITGDYFARGGRMQSCAVPEYFLEMISAPASANPIQPDASTSHRYRVTATGKGLSETTLVRLQAEFEVQTCSVEKIDREKNSPTDDQNDVQTEAKNEMQNEMKHEMKNEMKNGMQSNRQNDEKISGQLDTACIPHVRRLAWRMLHAS